MDGLIGDGSNVVTGVDLQTAWQTHCMYQVSHDTFVKDFAHDPVINNNLGPVKSLEQIAADGVACINAEPPTGWQPAQPLTGHEQARVNDILRRADGIKPGGR